jgi:hypothetical protein
LRVLLHRCWTNFYRDPSYNVTRFYFAAGISLLLGLGFYDLAFDQVGMRARVAALYFST